VFVGDTVLLLCTALGASSLLRTHPTAFMVVKYAGAAYLCWIGLNLLRGAVAGLRAPANTQLERHAVGKVSKADSGAHLQNPFRRALVISLLNPKAILFLLSFFVQFIDPVYDQPEVPFLILSVILMSFSALYLTVLIFAGAQLAHTFSQRRRLSGGLSSLVGCLFVWFGSKLATASLS
jgi:leucine efflux protein